LSSRSSNIFRRRLCRTRWSLYLAIVALAGTCSPPPVSAIDPGRTLSQYIHDSWGTDKGFPGGTVSSIVQTPDGFLWIGTDKGLVRFDGLNFRTFEQATPASFAIGPVRKLLVDGQGNLWILLQNTKLLRYRDGAFSLMGGEVENGITAIGQAGSPVLLSSIAMGVLVYKDGKFANASESLASAEARNDVPAEFTWSTGVALHRLMEPTGTVISLAATSDGKIWLGTQDRGLFYLYAGAVHAAGAAFGNLRINCAVPMGDRELWIGTNKGVLRWNGTELTRKGIPESLSDVEVFSIIQDRDSNIWVGTARTLVRVTPTAVSSVAGEALSPGSRVTALFEDREGNLWIGGIQRLERLRDSAFVTYSVPALQSPGALYVDPDDYTWVAPTEGGFWWLKAGNYGALSSAGLTRDVVYSISSTQRDSLWLGRQKGGLTHLQSIHGALRAKTYTRADGLAQDSVYSVFEARDGTVWSGTLAGGVSELKQEHFTNYTTADGLASNTVSSIAEGTDGAMWFGTPNGLTQVSANGWRTYRRADGLPSDDINCLLVDSTGVLWIGTAEGLAFFEAGQVHKLAAGPDSLHSLIFGIAEDKFGWLWIATADRVLQIKRPASLDKPLPEGDIREYGLGDGLHGTEGVKRDKSVIADSHGRIWFSTNRGLSVVNPDRANIDPMPALVQMEAVLADGSPLGFRSPLTVPGGHDKITFRFVGLSLTKAERVRYRYRLENFDKNWSEPQATREASYGNLAPGRYRFHVVASNSDGQWNGAEAALDLRIEPELWQTWWFRSGLVICLGLFAVALYRLRMQRLTRLLSVRFEERLAERTRIAQDLHDTLLQGVFSASIHFDVANNRLPHDSPAKPSMQRGMELLKQVSNEGRNTLLALRPSQSRDNDLAAALSQLRNEFAVPVPISFRVISQGEPQPLRPLLRDEVYLIAREAVFNAVRHAKPSSIEVEINYVSGNLRLLVRDDGCGIDAGLLKTGREGHWGLANMRERAERVGGKFEVLSRVNSGTVVQLWIPGKLAFEAGRPHGLWTWLASKFSRNSEGIANTSGKESGA
jgi:signal transduction histidine kinase/ligand-binding sensor domain-containing protein